MNEWVKKGLQIALLAVIVVYGLIALFSWVDRAAAAHSAQLRDVKAEEELVIFERKLQLMKEYGIKGMPK